MVGRWLVWCEDILALGLGLSTWLNIRAHGPQEVEVWELGLKSASMS